MPRNANKPRKPAAGHHGRGPGSRPSRPRRGPGLLQRLVVRGGRILFGILPRFRHIRAANDPEA